jgi:hypothetical protein
LVQLKAAFDLLRCLLKSFGKDTPQTVRVASIIGSFLFST